MENKKSIKVTSYDYKTIKASREMVTIICDSYNALGWELASSNIAESSPLFTNLTFRRERKINNKEQLLRAQEKIDSIISNIEIIQKNKKKAGVNWSIIGGVLGTLVFGGGMSLIMTIGSLPATVIGIITGCIGIGAMVYSHFLRLKIRKKTITKLNPVLESEFEKLSELNEIALQLQVNEA